MEGKIFIYYLFPNIYTCISAYYFQKSSYASFYILTLRQKNGACLYSSKKYKSSITNSVEFCYFAKPFCHKKVTCSSVKMLKGYMVICQNAEGVHGQRWVGNPWCRGKKKGTFPECRSYFEVTNRHYSEVANLRLYATRWETCCWTQLMCSRAVVVRFRCQITGF